MLEVILRFIKTTSYARLLIGTLLIVSFGLSKQVLSYQGRYEQSIKDCSEERRVMQIAMQDMERKYLLEQIKNQADVIKKLREHGKGN